MRIGLFTDTYFPQVSGVATSIRTLKTELEKAGTCCFIFTTTDKDVNRYEDWQIIRMSNPRTQRSGLQCLSAYLGIFQKESDR